MPAEGDGSEGAARAQATLGAITHPRMHDERRGLYGSRTPLVAWRRFEHLWPFANAWSAIAGLAGLSGPDSEATTALRRFLDAVGAYRRDPGAGGQEGRTGHGAGYESSVVPPLGPGGDRYFDDNAWIGLAMVRHFEVTGDDRALHLAREAFDFTASGWWSDAPVLPGGVRWKATAANRSRHTCSTAPAAELAVRLSELTGDDGALEWAARAYQWVRVALRSPDGLYFDRIDPQGTVERTRWTYNQGAMIGAGVLLGRATGERAYLEDAAASAAACVDHYGQEELLANGPAFNAIYYRNLFLLEQALDGDLAPVTSSRMRASARAYGDEMWATRRDGRTGLFSGSGSKLNDTAPMIEVYALLSGARPGA